MIPIVIGALGIIPKGLEKRQEELERRRIETIQYLARILRRVLETRGDSSERPLVKADVKNLQGINNNNNNLIKLEKKQQKKVSFEYDIMGGKCQATKIGDRK